MQNLFYVPPHQPQDQHPKPLGVKTVIKRNQPTRLDMSTLNPGLVQYDLQGDVTAPTPRRSALSAFRAALGHALIRLGRALTPEETNPRGQPA